MRSSQVIALFGLMLSVPGVAEARSEQTWATISDIGRSGLVAAAIATPLIKRDRQGLYQAAGSLATTTLLTVGLKETFPERRPDGSNRRSFPSGHTSTAFAAAATLYNRQGKAAGIPAFAIASLVGVARIEAKKHFYYDVLVGAGLGMASGFLITSKRPARAPVLLPWGDTKGGGISLAMRF